MSRCWLIAVIAVMWRWPPTCSGTSSEIANVHYIDSNEVVNPVMADILEQGLAAQQDTEHVA